MFLFPLLASLFLIGAVIFIFNLTPQQVSNDLMKFLSHKQTLRDKVKIAQGKKKSRKIIAQLKQIHDALSATGKESQFVTTCAVSLALLVCGGMSSILLDNILLVPILAVALALLPFIYAKTTIGYYHKHIELEMETALSIITTSYNRSDDIVLSVKENLRYLKPPITDIFKGFLGETTAVSSDIKKALHRLKGKIDNQIFKEWCDTLIQCQDDRTLKDSLLPVVGKLTDVRIVNNELKTMLYEPRKEYFMMVALVVGNIPLLYMLNKSWFHTLMDTIPGKIVLALTGVVILVTTLLMMKYTKPIEYRR